MVLAASIYVWCLLAPPLIALLMLLGASQVRSGWR